MGGGAGMKAPSASMMPRRARPEMGGGWSTSGHDGRGMMSGGGLYGTDMGMQNWLKRQNQPSYMGPPAIQDGWGGGFTGGSINDLGGGGGWAQPGTGGPISMPGYMDQELAPLGGPAPIARNIALQQMSPWARYR